MYKNDELDVSNELTSKEENYLILWIQFFLTIYMK